jgi:hypothetical protein
MMKENHNEGGMKGGTIAVWLETGVGFWLKLEVRSFWRPGTVQNVTVCIFNLWDVTLN